MNKAIFLLIVVLAVPALGEIFSTPTGTPTAVPMAATSPTPTATYNPYPTFPPKPTETIPEPQKGKKDPHWVSAMGLGGAAPLSAHLGQAYAPAFAAELGTGYRLSEDFSIWLDAELELFNSKDDNLTRGNNFNLVNLAFLGRYRFLKGGVSPYLFLGPGLAYNEDRSDQGLNYDASTGYGYIPINSYEFDLMLVGGIGMEVDLGGGIGTYLQAEYLYDMTSPGFAGQAYNDSPIMTLPMEIGLLFGL